MYVPDSELDITYCQEMHQIYSKRTVNTPGKFYFLMQFSPCSRLWIVDPYVLLVIIIFLYVCVFSLGSVTLILSK